MNHGNLVLFNPTSTPTPKPVAVLIKKHSMKRGEMLTNYVDPLVAIGIPLESIICIGLPYDTYKKVTAKSLDIWVPELQAMLDEMGTTHILNCDGAYLKRMAGISKVSNLAGVAKQNKFGNQTIYKGHNYMTFRFAPKTRDRLRMSMDALTRDFTLGSTVDPDARFTIKYAYTIRDMYNTFKELMEYDTLAADIEGFGLGLTECGVATIAFATSETEGVGMSIDWDGEVSHRPDWFRRNMLLNFMTAFTEKGGKFIYHGATFDVKQLVANLWMKNDLLDYEGLVDGSELLGKSQLCTKDMAYLATNSTEGNSLSLKHLALEYMGEYALDVKDITKHSLHEILKYNVKDCLATYYLFNKYTKILHERVQHDLYYTHYREHTVMLTALELYGMPMDMNEVVRLGEELVTDKIDSLNAMIQMPEVQEGVHIKHMAEWHKYQKSVKGDGRPWSEYSTWRPLQFNPNSNPQLVEIIHKQFEFPIVDTTKTKQASVGGDTIKKHLARAKEDPAFASAIPFLENLLVFIKVDKINDFVKAFLKHSILKKDGVYYLHGSFNQGGTISGRLSSSNPNLQNMPSSGKYGKAIKKCFKAPDGKVMLASDFNA